MPDIDLALKVPRARLAVDSLVVVKEGSPDDMDLVFFIPEIGPDRFYSFNDLVSVTANEVWAISNTGTGAAFSLIEPPSAGGIGWMRGALGTTATGRISIGTALNNLRLSFGRAIMSCRFRQLTLSDAVSTYSTRIGFLDTISAESTDGVFFRYTHSVNGGKWQAVTRNNNVETAVDTLITNTANQTYKFLIDINAAGTEALFYIDGVLTNTITTNIPTGASPRTTGCGMMCLRTVGTGAINVCEMDYIALEQRFTGR